MKFHLKFLIIKIIVMWFHNVSLVEGRNIYSSSRDLRRSVDRSVHTHDAELSNITDIQVYTSTEPVTDESRAVKNDPWQKYYDFIINEGSFKFWAVFQVATALLLIYSSLAAVYYAKYNFIQPDYEYDYFFGRSDSGASTVSSSLWTEENTELFQRILDAIASKKYS